MLNSEVRKGSTELLILSLVEDKPRHGYEIGKLIEQRSGGRLRPSIPSLYPTLCRMERRGWIKGSWVEKPSERRRRYYRLTATGRKNLAKQRESWQEFIAGLTQVAGIDHA